MVMLSSINETVNHTIRPYSGTFDFPLPGLAYEIWENYL